MLYVAIRTRPDIANAVRLAAKYTCFPGVEHCRLINRIFGYLKGTVDYSITFGGKTEAELTLDVWSDSDWMTDPDGRYSTSGTIITLNNGIVYSKCRGQTCVAQSTMEAEYIALSDSVQRAIPVWRILSDMGLNVTPSRIRVLVDSEAAKAYITAPKHNWRNSHIDRRFHFVRERYHNGEFGLYKVKGEYNVADICTKNCKSCIHQRLREWLFGNVEYPEWNEMIDTSTGGLYVG